ncbi:M15 family metallopeptidase [Syntrophomonas wolfei]|uniref:Peptidase M15C domain-containing protein n=1 Tax=Syntrophomonas wolfei subsp. wolfei (strain DSM 2245B / Goettingen) TaxID=335541 RepID=Q0AVH5_SYNWW|nr:M15 family metallopeptidase [Syntrophomonas wolfei]ABI69279.1 hypothetical protein Swol_1984 [Syntrophomonas wolfei subsp. wolfei str. Goettingen G311]
MNKKFSWIFIIVALTLLTAFLIIPEYRSARSTVGTIQIHKEGNQLHREGMTSGDGAQEEKKLIAEKPKDVPVDSVNDKKVDLPVDKKEAMANKTSNDSNKKEDMVQKISNDRIEVSRAGNSAAGNEQSSRMVEGAQTSTGKSQNSQLSQVADNSEYPQAGKSTSQNSADNSPFPHISKVQGSFGQFRYKDLSGGRIEIDPRWMAENIVTITLPGLDREVQVHKEARDNFIRAFNYIKNGSAWINGKEVPLLSLVKTMDGTFVPRHVNWDSAKGLSRHSWGTAIDINAANHFRRVDPEQEANDPNLILWEKAFKPAGFSWGNSYSDSMHYELLE